MNKIWRPLLLLTAIVAVAGIWWISRSDAVELRVKVLDSVGVPIEGVRVTIGGADTAFGTVIQTTDASGVTSKRVPVGLYTVRAGDDSSTSDAMLMDLSSFSSPVREVELMIPQREDLASLEGRYIIVDDSGMDENLNILPEYPVVLSHVRTRNAYFASGDSQGLFRFEKIRPGEYEIMVLISENEFSIFEMDPSRVGPIGLGETVRLKNAENHRLSRPLRLCWKDGPWRPELDAEGNVLWKPLSQTSGEGSPAQ